MCKHSKELNTCTVWQIIYWHSHTRFIMSGMHVITQIIHWSDNVRIVHIRLQYACGVHMTQCKALNLLPKAPFHNPISSAINQLWYLSGRAWDLNFNKLQPLIKLSQFIMGFACQTWFVLCHCVLASSPASPSLFTRLLFK